jgi:putative membrane protein
MANSRGITALILTLGLTGLISTACETQTERTTVTETTPSPGVGATPSPNGAASPYASPAGSPVALTTSEREFISQAARGGLEEVQLGRLAAEKAANPEVKQLAGRISTDHEQLNQKLQQLGSNLNITLDQQLSPEQQNTVSRLEKLSGRSFDREYIKAMINDHVKTISEFERAASQATNADIKQFVSDALPKLREHLSAAREIAGKLGVKTE